MTLPSTPTVYWHCHTTSQKSRGRCMNAYVFNMEVGFNKCVMFIVIILSIITINVVVVVVIVAIKGEGKTKKKVSPSPQPLLVRVVFDSDGTFDTPFNDQLGVRGFEDYRSVDYQLGESPTFFALYKNKNFTVNGQWRLCVGKLFCVCAMTAKLPSDNFYFVVCPRDIVVARERTIEDHVTWHVENKKFEVSCHVAIFSKRRHVRGKKRLYLSENTPISYRDTLYV